MLKIQGLSHSYSPKELLFKDFNLELKSASFNVLLGASGSGKSTLLKCIAGVESFWQGEIFLDGQPIHWLVPHKRPVSLVFQDLALWPQWTVEKSFNVLLEGETTLFEKPFSWWLDFFELKGVCHRLPHELSGGEAQRVAILRALVKQPKVLLLDEPFAHLDYSLREKSRQQLYELAQARKMIVLFVTHDPSESLSLADQVFILSKGKVLSQGTPQHLYTNPCHPEIAQLLGRMNFFQGTLSSEPNTLKSVFGSFTFSVPVKENQGLGLWPEQIILTPEGRFQGEVVEVGFLSGRWLVRFHYENQFWLAYSEHRPQEKGIRFSVKTPCLLEETHS